MTSVSTSGGMSNLNATHYGARKAMSGRKKPRSKAAKKAKAKVVMGEFKAGKLHSGSKKGPIVKSRRQAVAILMSQTGQSKK